MWNLHMANLALQTNQERMDSSSKNGVGRIDFSNTKLFSFTKYSSSLLMLHFPAPVTLPEVRHGHMTCFGHWMGSEDFVVPPGTAEII